VVGVAVEEFEAWLIADQLALKHVLHRPDDKPPAPQSMAPGQAKELFGRLMAEGDQEPARRAAARCAIARHADLGVLSKCSAFERLRHDLRDALPHEC
jgi:hypothetical protein